MYENLETSFLQQYPKFEIIFAIADPDDPAIRVANDLIAKYPDIDARIDIGKVLSYPLLRSLIAAFQ